VLLPTGWTVPVPDRDRYFSSVRNRYLDLLRAAAIVRVVVYHLFGWPWLSIVLPAMGIMFALAGSLMAASLDNRAAGRVVTSRLRRLLPPLWLLGVIAVPVMLVAGWAAENDGDHPFRPSRLAFWLLPLGDPPGSDLAIDVWEPLWYIRAYVWFVLLSPVLYAVYRRVGWLAVAAPIGLLGLLDVTGFSLRETADAAMWDFATYGACWIAGFAHHDGRLARLRPWQVVSVAAVLGGVALYWLRGHQSEQAWDLNDVSESQALWSVAFVLLALRWQPPMGWLSRIRPLDGAVTLLNERAVTVYLWHNIAIAAVWPVLTVVALDDLAGELGAVTDLAVALALTAVAVLAFGWAEDLAARRRPRLLPVGARAPKPAGNQADAGVPERDADGSGMPGRDAGGPNVPGKGADSRSVAGKGAADRSAAFGVPAEVGTGSRAPASWPPVQRPAAEAEPPASRAGRHAAAADEAEEARLDLGMPAGGLRAAWPGGSGLPVAGQRPEPVESGEWFDDRGRPGSR
jgi:peptidoglycan/LPS O-acetylase OafA/YrhL